MTYLISTKKSQRTAQVNQVADVILSSYKPYLPQLIFSGYCLLQIVIIF